MPIREMVEQSPCCMNFLQEIMKLEEKASNEEFISLTKNSCAINEFQVPRKEEDPECSNVHVTVGDVYVGEALCNLGAGGNLMPLATFKLIGGEDMLHGRWTCIWDHNNACRNCEELDD